MGETRVTDQKTTGNMQPYQVWADMRCAGACTYGYGVSVDSSGYVTNSATATLTAVIGVAGKTGAAGDIIPVLIGGWCDFGVSDGSIADSDIYVTVVDGGQLDGVASANTARVGKNPLVADTGSAVSFWVAI